MRPPPATGYMVYLLIDPRDRLPFYVGMTCRPTARWAYHNTSQCSAAHDRLAELRIASLKCRARIVASDLDREIALEREAELIAVHHRTLVNKLGLPKRLAA